MMPWCLTWVACACGQVSAASASGRPADLDTISEELFRQLSAGQTVNLSAVLGRAAAGQRNPASALPPPPSRQPPASAPSGPAAAEAGEASLPEAVVAHAPAKRDGVRAAQPAPPSTAAAAPPAVAPVALQVSLRAYRQMHAIGARSRCKPCTLIDCTACAAAQHGVCCAQDIRAGKAALRRVDAQALAQQKQRAAREDSLEARLREGLAKFRFNDTAGSSATDDFSP